VHGDGNRFSGARSFLHETAIADEQEPPQLDYELPEWIKSWMAEAFTPADPATKQESDNDEK
ncbi:MAG: hypothetical protein K6T85_09005, partial [Gorillibacterium sp.]|nr:hypothetical protein [Gorillibacterium sp.]